LDRSKPKSPYFPGLSKKWKGWDLFLNILKVGHFSGTVFSSFGNDPDFCNPHIYIFSLFRPDRFFKLMGPFYQFLKLNTFTHYGIRRHLFIGNNWGNGKFPDLEATRTGNQTFAWFGIPHWKPGCFCIWNSSQMGTPEVFYQYDMAKCTYVQKACLEGFLVTGQWKMGPVSTCAKS